MTTNPPLDPKTSKLLDQFHDLWQNKLYKESLDILNQAYQNLKKSKHPSKLIIGRIEMRFGMVYMKERKTVLSLRVAGHGGNNN